MVLWCIYLLYDNNFKLKNMEFEPKITYLAKAPKEFKQNAKIITFDIETYRDDNEVFIPYACGFYDGKNKKLYYLTDYKSPNDMISQCIEDMLQPKYHNYTVYAHNLAKFDISFIFRILVIYASYLLIIYNIIYSYFRKYFIKALYI